jgi:hypothetical protein
LSTPTRASCRRASAWLRVSSDRSICRLFF